MVKHSSSTRTSHLPDSRIRLFVFGFFVITGILGYRLFTLSFVNHTSYAQTAERQQRRTADSLAGRGNIYTFDRSLNEKKLVATNSTIEGELKRLYPKGLFAGQTLGFVGFRQDERVGQYGVEGFYDKELRERSDLVLTIDPNIQAYSEAALNAVVKKWSATGGSILIQEPATGALLAMASSPSFDPNRYAGFALDTFVNPATQKQFEPGSSFKAVTMSAALDGGAVTPDTTYTDTGQVVIADRTIKNFDEKAHGVQTMRQVLEKSLNTGTIFAQAKTGNDKFLNYVVGFGFGQKTGVGLAGEAVGNIGNLYEGRPINFGTASFGQGIAVTPLQLINAYSAIANGGRLMKPTIVREMIHQDGTTTRTIPVVVDAPISEKTSIQMRAMLADVVDYGFDKARVKGYEVAGKSGTAQIPDARGGYLGEQQFIHNFAGFVPAYNPEFVILIKLDKPKGITFAADSLSPVFGDLASFMVRYLKIPPTR